MGSRVLRVGLGFESNPLLRTTLGELEESIDSTVSRSSISLALLIMDWGLSGKMIMSPGSSFGGVQMNP